MKADSMRHPLRSLGSVTAALLLATAAMGCTSPAANWFIAGTGAPARFAVSAPDPVQPGIISDLSDQ